MRGAADMGVGSCMVAGVPVMVMLGCGMQLVDVAVAHVGTGFAACAIGSAPFQFNKVKDGVVVQGPNWNLAET